MAFLPRRGAVLVLCQQEAGDHACDPHTQPGSWNPRRWLEALLRLEVAPRFLGVRRVAMAYISSGALTPIRSRPLRSTWRVASPRARRALRSSSSSTMTLTAL